MLPFLLALTHTDSAAVSMQLGAFLYDENIEWATSRELHGLAALTFNDHECAVLYAMLL